jgi:D-alanine-D-alanine ligase
MTMNPTHHDITFEKVAVLMGGQSAERSISLRSGQAVLNALLAQHINAVGIDVDEHIADVLVKEKIDCACIMLHGRGGEDGTIQGLLEVLRIPYTGSGVLASALAMNKLKTKQIWRALNISTPNYVALSAKTNWSEVIHELELPVMVKPAHEGSSYGASRVNSPEQLPTAYALAAQYDDLVIAEQWITGAEFSVSILNGEALPAIQLKTNRDFYNFEAKYVANDTQYLCPCGLSNEDEKKLQELALNAFNAVGCAGYGRVDVMQSEQGIFYALEVNTLPGMTDHSLVPMAAQAVGISFEQLTIEILKTARNESTHTLVGESA